MKIKNILVLLVLILLLAGSQLVHAKDPSKATEASFDRGAAKVQKQLVKSLAELSALRKHMAQKKIPLNRKLNDLEGELVKIRLNYQKTSRLLDSHTLDLSNFRNEIKSRREETTYLSNLLGEYVRNFESRLHIAEIRRYEKPLETAKLAPENSNLSEEQAFQAQIGLVAASLKRLHDVLGGVRFKGTAVDARGLIKSGTFVLVGPAALFRSEDGSNIGTAEQRLGSLEPAVIGFQNPEDVDAATRVITESFGYFPLDPTLGNAHKIEATQETFLEHIRKGGPVMVPIFILGGAAFLVALYKWLVLVFQRKPSQRKIRVFLDTVARHDKNAATRAAKAVGGPVGKMLSAGVEHLQERRELIEEVMFEMVLAKRLKLQSFLPFIAISASAAPLLGLLGTVTGIINTFKLITLFGSGDVKTLSGGISEALITTKFGLIVAIPSLLIHAFLSRKAQRVIAQMERAAVAFINQVYKTPYRRVNEKAESDTKMSGKLPRSTGQGVKNKDVFAIEEAISQIVKQEPEKYLATKALRNTEELVTSDE